MNRGPEFYLKWSATIVIVLGTIANAADMVPLNKILFLVGCGLWVWLGIVWKQPAVWALNLFCSIVYLVGLLYLWK